jgi:hypothetical protein
MAVTLPEDQQGSAATQAGEFDALTGVDDTDDGTVGVEARLATGSEDDARQLSGGLSTGLARFQGDDSLDAGARQLLDSVEISQDGSDVVLTFESDVETLLELSESQ